MKIETILLNYSRRILYFTIVSYSAEFPYREFETEGFQKT